MSSRSPAGRTTRRLRHSRPDTSGEGSDRLLADPAQLACGSVAHLDGTFGTDWVEDNLARAGMPRRRPLRPAPAPPDALTRQ